MILLMKYSLDNGKN